MSPADRLAFVDRLARARAWNRLEEHERATFRRAAEADIAEIEIAKDQTDRIGWMLIEVEREHEGSEA